MRSPLGIALLKKKRKKPWKFLHLDKFSSKDEALENLEKYTREDQEIIMKEWASMLTACRPFATEQVADRLYGGEKGNEFFRHSFGANRFSILFQRAIKRLIRRTKK